MSVAPRSTRIAAGRPSRYLGSLSDLSPEALRSALRRICPYIAKKVSSK